MRWLASSIALAGSIALGCVSRSSGTDLRLAVVDRQFFAQCPFAVQQPSTTLVTDRSKWQQMLANARTAPPPFEASATAFDTNSVIIFAARATATPRTRLWVGADAITLDAAARKLRLDVDIVDMRPAAGELELTVVGMPCLVIWTSRVVGVDRIEARNAATGELLVEVRAP